MERTIRADIQALRGLAVLLVVLYHAKVPMVRAGYLGVDIFFVISGYLITRLVKNQIEEGRFGFADFYARRMRRLLPAAYTTFLATALAAAVLLNGGELRDFRAQLAGALAFAGNFVLWQQSGYFEGAAALKPLLHVWSLAIEEQYYLLLPASLVFVPRRLWTPGALAVLLSSLGLCVFLGARDPGATFYLMPTRAWELAIGSVGALALDHLNWEGSGWGDAMYWVSAAALVGIPLRPLGGAHPGLNALVVCAATLAVILARKEALAVELPGRILGWFGDISYSLYLVHWPLFAFLHNVWFGYEPQRVRYALVLLSVALAYLQYRFVETPFRRSNLRLDWKTAGWVLAGTALIAAIPFVEMRRRAGGPDYNHIRRVNYGFSRDCHFTGDYSTRPGCNLGGEPSILLWGDSFAMHLVEGISKNRGGVGVVQATQGSCGPLLGLAVFERDYQGTSNRGKADSCTQFNDSVVRYLARPESPGTVVIASAFSSYLWERYRVLEDGQHEREPGIETTLRHFKRTVDAVRAAGKRVVVVAPMPGAGFNIGNCLERKMSGRWIAGPFASCEFPLARYHLWQAPMIEMLKRIQREADVDVIGFEDLLCPDGMCRTTWEGKFLYRDDWHLSYGGSEVVARHSGLVGQILAKAR